MRLADFIDRKADSIVDEWESFARTCQPAAAQMSALELRNHARHILAAVSSDLRTAQTREERTAKSKGMAPTVLYAAQTAAETHAVLRAKSGFDIRQLVSEYRALRASVLRLAFDAWAPEEVPMDDVLRFNEAIDQALAESVSVYSGQVERSRNLLLGMLGHDMRSPLQAIQLTAAHLHAMNAGDEVSRAASRLITSGGEMQQLLDDLVDFNRTQLGLGISVRPEHIDLSPVLAAAAEVVRASRPGRLIITEAPAECRGWWDAHRLRQALGNLMINALDYGKPSAPIRVALMEDGETVVLKVENEGSQIPKETHSSMFQPLRRGESQSGRSDGGLGLGLFIAREVARAHGGDLHAQSDEQATVFSISLPRRGLPRTEPEGDVEQSKV